MLLAALVAGEHVLLEDAPGTGKTTIIKALSRACGLPFKRIQMTSDVMPADLSGGRTFDPKDQTFSFKPGPLFTHFLLVDEINRAPPKTQSALLEVMAERQVTVDGETHKLPEFFLMATQNETDPQRGTHRLPMAQLDRFAIKMSLGFLPFDQELAMINGQLLHDLGPMNPGQTPDSSKPIQPDMIWRQRGMLPGIHISQELITRTLRFAQATRESVQAARHAKSWPHADKGAA